MAANPNITPIEEFPFEQKTWGLCEPKPVSRKNWLRDLLLKIFKGHEEFAGWTPD